MTVESTNSTISYTGNGSVTVFSYNFLTYDETHLFVYLDDVEQVTGYSVSGIGDDNGGSVTFDVAPLNEVEVRIDRTVPVTQEIEYQEYGPFPAKTNERGLDLGVMINQQNERDTSRNATEKMDKQTLAPENNIVTFDSTGNSKDSGFNIDDIDGFTPVEQPRQVGDNIETQFDTPSDVNSSPFEFQVRIDGLRMRGQTDYTTNNIGKIDFVQPPGNLTEIDITWYKPLLGADVVTISDALINDLSQAYEFPTVADYKAFETEFPVGKTIYLKDRESSFTIIAGVLSNTGNGIIKSDQVNQSASIINNHGIANAFGYGALPDDGVTDSTEQFAEAGATGLSVFVPKKAGYYKADIELQDDQTIFSYDAEIRPALVMTVKHASTGSTIDGLIITGNGKADAGAGVVGVSALGSLETKTQNVTIKDFKGDGYQRNECVDRHQGNHLINAIIKDNITGINEGTRSEYNKTLGCSVFGNDVGIRVKGGNNNYGGSTVTDNGIGVHLVGGSNDAHGVCSGLTINHNTTANIFADNITVPSFNFTGCEVWAGDVHLLNSNGVTFTGSSFSIVEIKEENARYCSFSSCHFVSAITVSPNYNGTFSEVYYHDSNIYNDTSMTRPTFFPEGSRSTATLENSLLALADGSTTNVLDTLSSNAISGNPLFAWQAMFQTPANVFDGTKKTRVDGSLIHFTGEINVTRPTSYIPDADVKVQLFSSVRGIVATATLARQSDNGSTLYTNVYRLDAMIARENDTYELRVVNNSGGDVNVYRDQTGDLVCNCSAWGW